MKFTCNPWSNVQLGKPREICIHSVGRYERFIPSWVERAVNLCNLGPTRAWVPYFLSRILVLFLHCCLLFQCGQAFLRCPFLQPTCSDITHDGRDAGWFARFIAN